MDKFLKSDQFQCNVTSSPGTRPLLHRRLSVQPIMVRNREPSFEEFQGSDNQKTLYDIGEILINMKLGLLYYSDEDQKFLEELAIRNFEAYIYSGIPGSIFQHCPLTRGVRGDPSNGTYTASVVKGTTVYFPMADASSRVWLEETDLASYPILSNGVHFKDLNIDLYAIFKELPLGRGVVILSEAENVIKNSLFADDGSSVYNWTHSGGLGVTRKDDTGWMGVPSLWTWGIGSTWTSDAFFTTGMAVGTRFAVSFGWRTDGQVKVKILFNGATPVTVDIGTYLCGCGYEQEYVTIPTGYGSGTDPIYLIMEVIAGDMSEICAPQIVLGDPTYGCLSYPVFLGGAGPGVKGEITSQSLKFEGKWQVGMHDLAFGTSSGIIASGYVMPLFKIGEARVQKNIFTLEDSRTNKDTGCYLQNVGLDLKMITYSNGTTYSSVAIPDFVKGDVLFVALYVGFAAGSYRMGVKIRKVGGSTTYSAEDTTGVDKYMLYDTLWIGCDENESLQADCLFQDVNVWAGSVCSPGGMVDAMVEYMTVLDNLRTIRDTLGRVYRLVPNLSPNPTNAQRHEGEILCINTKVL